ncbi:hypothetical protein [Dickeya phage Sucellus]|nr:hypothetical protein [Dickeya phage Sucellus]
MSSYKITHNINIYVDKDLGLEVSYDKNADFDQIILRVRNGVKFVNFRVTDLVDTVQAEFWHGYKSEYVIVLINSHIHQQAFQTMMDNFLNK